MRLIISIHKGIWNAYREVINRNCTDDRAKTTSLSYWQNRLFAASVIYIIPLSLIALIPGVYMAYQANFISMIVVDFFAVAIILSVAFAPGISVFTRKVMFNGVLYLTSTTLLLYLGAMGPGLLYLLGITIFIVLSLDKIYAYIAVALNTLICIVIGFFIYFGWGNFELLAEYGLGSWIAVSSNLVFLSGAAALLIPILFEGLRSTLVQENSLRSELENEKRKLQDINDQLDDKNQELEQFAYTISHDLKEPLRMVQSFMELLEKKYAGQLDDKARKYIFYAVDGARRMSNSIDDLLEYSRIGRMYTALETINTKKLVEEVCSLVTTKDDANIQIGNLPQIKAVPVTIKKLFQNLVSNGIKYQPEGQKPEIEISGIESDSHWTFSVSDNGIGVDKAYQDEIFGIFKRLHTRDAYPGNGMGLAICKKIVEHHGGTIWIESEEGKGSTFHFTIKKEIL